MTLAFFFPTNSHASRMSFAEKRLPTPGYSRDMCSRLNIEVRGAIRGKADRLCDDTVLPSANSAARWPCSSPAPPCALRPSATRSLSSGASSTTVRLSAVLAALTAATCPPTAPAVKPLGARHVVQRLMLCAECARVRFHHEGHLGHLPELRAHGWQLRPHPEDPPVEHLV
jgi:hypothetical protein